MKGLRRVFCTALSLCLLLTAAFPVLAEEEGGYTYTVRFFAGRQGLFSGSEVMVIDGLHYGDQVSFSQRAISLNDDSKYYIRGIRESGKDNNTATQIPSFTVTGDQDYVVAYGILGDATSYTINYVDEEGDTLAPSESYYGNVGDRPVVAYLYLEGYRPQAYNLTQTLEKDPAQNVFTFIYTRLGAGGGGGGTTETAPAAPAEGGTPEAPAAPAAAAPAGVTVIPGGGAGAAAGGAAAGADGAAAGTVEAPDGEVPQAEQPEELVDLDDEDVPLAGLPSIFEIGNDARLLGIPVAAVAGAGIILIGGSWYFLVAKKRKKKEEKS